MQPPGGVVTIMVVLCPCSQGLPSCISPTFMDFILGVVLYALSCERSHLKAK